VDGAGDAAGLHEVADLEGTENDQEHTGGEVGEKTRPGGSDRNAGSGDEGGEGGCFNSKVPEDGDDESDVECDAYAGDQPLNQCFFDLLAAQSAAEQVGGKADEPAPN